MVTAVASVMYVYIPIYVNVAVYVGMLIVVSVDAARWGGPFSRPYTHTPCGVDWLPDILVLKPTWTVIPLIRGLGHNCGSSTTHQEPTRCSGNANHCELWTTLDGFSSSIATLTKNTHSGNTRGIQTMTPTLSKSTAPKP